MRDFVIRVIVRRLLSVAGVAAATGAATPAEPPPLRGAPLTGQTGLRLLVANDPPVLLDVDSGRITRITGLQVRDKPVLSVSAVGRDAVVWLARRTTGGPRAEIYVVRHDATKATRLATAWHVAPSRDGRAVWLMSFDAAVAEGDCLSAVAPLESQDRDDGGRKKDGARRHR